MPQSKEVHKDYMRKRRGSREGSQNMEGSQDLGVQGSQKAGFTTEGSHPVLKYLIPGEGRKKMESIVLELKKHNQLKNVFLGAGTKSIPMDVVGELLECTR